MTSIDGQVLLVFGETTSGLAEVRLLMSHFTAPWNSECRRHDRAEQSGTPGAESCQSGGVPAACSTTNDGVLSLSPVCQPYAVWVHIPLRAPARQRTRT